MSETTASLPKNWTPLTGLEYPMTLHMLDGNDIVVKSYNEHHGIIKTLFKDKYGR